MGPTAFDGNLDLDELFFQRVLKYVSKNKAAKLFAHMLQTATNESVSSIKCGWFNIGIPTVSLLCIIILVFCFCSCVLVNWVRTSKQQPSRV